MLDRIMRHEGRGNADVWTVLVVLGAVGLVMAVFLAVSLATQPWELDAGAPTVASDEGECRPLLGAAFEIEVEGQRHLCGGGDQKCAWGPVDVAYDPSAPERCRVAANVGGLSDYEGLGVSITIVFVLAGISGLSYRVSERLRMADLVDGGHSRMPARTRLRALAWVCLIGAVVGGNAFAAVFFSSQL